jgi:hypothetical protein
VATQATMAKLEAGMKDVAKMTLSDIEAELREANSKLMEARESGGKVAELETRVWRLLCEKRFRQTNGVGRV